MTKERLYLFDTTLRDGAQTAGIEFSLEDKIRGRRAARGAWRRLYRGRLSRRQCRSTTEFFDEKRTKRANFTAFGMTKRAGRSVGNDPGVQALLNSAGRGGLLCRQGLGPSGRSRARNLADGKSRQSARDASPPSVAAGKETLVDCEHFFDGFKANPDYALACVTTALDAGARWVVLCDTNGGTMPGEIAEIVARGAGGRAGRPARHPRP